MTKKEWHDLECGDIIMYLEMDYTLQKERAGNLL